MIRQMMKKTLIRTQIPNQIQIQYQKLAEATQT